MAARPWRRVASLSAPSRLETHDSAARANTPIAQLLSRCSDSSRTCPPAMFTLGFSVNMTKHKHLKLDQSKIDRAKRLLGAKTEQETIERALDLVLQEEAILAAHRRVKAVGGFEDVFR
jgi:hypothetical protein